VRQIHNCAPTQKSFSIIKFKYKTQLKVVWTALNRWFFSCLLNVWVEVRWVDHHDLGPANEKARWWKTVLYLAWHIEVLKVELELNPNIFAVQTSSLTCHLHLPSSFSSSQYHPKLKMCSIVSYLSVLWPLDLANVFISSYHRHFHVISAIIFSVSTLVKDDWIGSYITTKIINIWTQILAI